MNKLKAGGIHLLLSVAIGLVLAFFVFFVWYPEPYWQLSKGAGLFVLIVGVDVVLGPFLTLVIFNPKKSRKELLLDFSLIGLIQLLGLLYGLWSVLEARPLYTVFEYDRFRVVHANDIPENVEIPEEFRLKGYLAKPVWLGLRPLLPAEKFELTAAAVSGGVIVAAQPSLWQSYEKSKNEIISVAQPGVDLITRFPSEKLKINQILSKNNIGLDDVLFLPMQGRSDDVWTVLIDKNNALPLDFLQVDSF